MFSRAFALTIAIIAAVDAPAETVKGPEPPPCDYSAYPMHRTVKLRGLLQLVTYGGGRSANAPKWTTAHTLSIDGTTCDFEVHAPPRFALASYDGYIVEITGAVTQ